MLGTTKKLIPTTVDAESSSIICTEGNNKQGDNGTQSRVVIAEVHRGKFHWNILGHMGTTPNGFSKLGTEFSIWTSNVENDIHKSLSLRLFIVL